MAKTNPIQNTACTLEGVLFLPDYLQKALQGVAEYQSAGDYKIPKGLELKNEMSRAFQIAQSLWSVFKFQCDPKSDDVAKKTQVTETFLHEFLRDVLGYAITPAEPVVVGERLYQLTHRAQNVPVVSCPFSQTLDEPTWNLVFEEGNGLRKSAFQMAQELLNATEEYRWALVSNGLRIRLLRDATSLTRFSFLEFNLEDILDNARFGEFCQMWRVLHASRSVEKEAECIWDQWVKQGAEDGKRARDTLSINVVNALLALGNGFIQNDKNTELRRKLDEGTLSHEAFMRQLLRLMYRFIFLFCLEERDLLNTKDDVLAKSRYERGYALHRFREPSLRRRFKNQYTDAWDSVRIVFRGLTKGEPRLALPALGGLFADEQCLDLIHSALANEAFYEVMKQLRWDMSQGQVYAIDYKNMGTEELGSVYESLLELVPSINTETRTFAFVGLTVEGTTTGNTRKMTSSYYTPDELVQSLLHSALDPVIESTIKAAREKGLNQEEALLNMTVIDPAMGSGHFCLAAARHMAMRLVNLRTLGATPTPEEYRHALRQVIERCIYGVDLNPLAVELARMALWLEGFEEGKPLSFLDHHLKVGNSLVGVFDADTISLGISKKAFSAKAGDDKAVCKALNKRNAEGLKFLQQKKAERDFQMGAKNAQGAFDFTEDPKDVMEAFSRLDEQATDTVEAVLKKREEYESLQLSETWVYQRELCDVLIGAYMAPKTEQTEKLVPTTHTLAQLLYEGEVPSTPDQASLKEQIAYAHQVCHEANVFHWPIEFPHVMRQGGFSVVLGNPPWDKPKVEDVKWFATRYPEIADASTASKRKKMIEQLAEGRLASGKLAKGDSERKNLAEIALYRQYEEAVRLAECASTLGHLEEEEGGRFPMTGVGDTDLFAYFAELAQTLVHKTGRVGLVLPTGILTSSSTQAFAKYLLNGNLIQFYDFENREKIFPIDSRYRFALVTMGQSKSMNLVFYAQNFKDLEDTRRHINFESQDVALMNPNTGTSPILRSQRDLEISRKIYKTVPVLIKDNVNGLDENLWGIKYLRMFDMSSNSDLFSDQPFPGTVPLYEGKMIHQFDDRYATYISGDKQETRTVLTEEKTTKFKISPRYWVNASEVSKVWEKQSYHLPFVLGFRDIASATNERTLIASVLNTQYAFGNKLPLLLLPEDREKLLATLLGNLNSIVADYCIRQKMASSSVNLYILQQIPILPPDSYTDIEIEFIAKRVAQLTRTSDEMNAIWLTDYPASSFGTDRERLEIRAELDALYAKKYGLNRSDLEFILDPSEAESPDYPSVTFPGLKRNEIEKYGEFLTRRLVLEAFDKLEQYGVEGFDQH